MANGLTADGLKTTIGFWDGLSAKSRQGGFFFISCSETAKTQRVTASHPLSFSGFGTGDFSFEGKQEKIKIKKSPGLLAVLAGLCTFAPVLAKSNIFLILFDLMSGRCRM